jgi:hypothetical protein
MHSQPTGYIRARAGKLQAVITIAGEKIRKATGYRVGQEAEAQRFLEDLLRELGGAAPAPAAAAAPPADDAELTFQAWGDRWVAERKLRGVISAPDEEAHLRYHAYPQLGATALRALTKARMLSWVRNLQGRKRIESGEPLSPRYIHHIAATVRRLLAEAVDVDLIPSSPCT